MQNSSSKAMSGRGRPQSLANQKNALGQGLDPRIILKYEPIVQQLLKNPFFEKENLCTPENCARIIIQIQLFMDQKLGHKTKTEEHFMTKIPAKFFRDYSINGSIQFILATAFSFRHQVQESDPSALRRYDLLSEKQKFYARDLCLLLKNKLIEAKFLKIPIIYIWDDVDKQLYQELVRIIQRHEGILTNDIQQCSHIILNSQSRDTKDNEHYAREIFREGNRSFAHWWYFPDSWDFWSSSLGTPENELISLQNPPDGIWKVGYDWLTDMEEFNEWLCELDYEIFDLPKSLFYKIIPHESTFESSRLISENRKSSRRKSRHHSSFMAYPESETSTTEQVSFQDLNNFAELDSNANNLATASTFRDINNSRRLDNTLNERTKANISETSDDNFNKHIENNSTEIGNNSTERLDNNLTESFDNNLSNSLNNNFTESFDNNLTERFDNDSSKPLNNNLSESFDNKLTSDLKDELSYDNSFDTNNINASRKRSNMEENFISTKVNEVKKRIFNSEFDSINSEILNKRELTSESLFPSADNSLINTNSDEIHMNSSLSDTNLSELHQNSKLNNTTLSESNTNPTTNLSEFNLNSLSNANLDELHPFSTLNYTNFEELRPQPPKVSIGAIPLPEGGISLAALSDTSLYTDIIDVSKKLNNSLKNKNENKDVLVDKKDETNTLERDEDNNSTLSNATQLYSTETRFLNASSSNEQPKEIDTDVYQYQPMKNLHLTNELFTNEKAKILNLSTHSSSNSQILPEISLGTPPDRPPPPNLNKNNSFNINNDILRDTISNSVLDSEIDGNIILPTCSLWFDMNSVHYIEKDQLSALFTGSSASIDEMESSYKHIRNIIVSTYRRNPNQYLSSTDCRKIIDGDAALILRLFSFLDYWGIINFQADPSTILNVTFKGKDFCLSDTLYSDNDTSYPSTISQNQKNNSNQNSPKSSFLKPSVYPQKGGGPWKCASCGKICLYTYYVIRPGGTTGISMGVLDKCVWCVKCFGNGKYPSNLTHHQFLKVDIPIAEVNSIDSEWTSSELEKLIEGIELYREDWESVAKHVGTGKTPQQCIAYFISLPIDEPFSNTSNSNEENSNPSSIPFQDIANPLLAQLAFLASIVDPSVAAVAAKAALDSIMQSNKNNQSNISSSINTNSEKFNKTVNFGPLPEQHIPYKNFINESSAEVPDGFISKVDLQVACSAAIAAAAVRSKELALIEEDKIRKLLPQLIDLRLQKIDLKRQCFNHIEKQISQDKDILEQKYESLMSEWNEMIGLMKPNGHPSI